MKDAGMLLVTALVVLLISAIAYAGNTAGGFRLPFDPNQHWSACGSIGFRDEPPNGQYFMNLNDELEPPKYHLAEDWNGKCGGSTDLGAVLYAIADGMVKDLRDVDTNDNAGKLLLISHPLPDGTFRDILYEHILNIEVNPRTGAKFKASDPVYIGETIARLGDGNGFYAGRAHLHFEMRRDTSTSMTLLKNPYYQPLKISDALRYSSPSLFIDDRNKTVVQNLLQEQWTYFSQNTNAPSSTAFIEYNGDRYSLRIAVDKGLIYKLLYEQRSGTWYPYSNITDVFFNAGYAYAIYSYVPGIKLNILIPGDHFREDRAKIDMLHAASADSRFTDIKAEKYQENLSWDLNWELRQVDFGFSSSPGRVTMYQITLKTNPLVRATGFSNPANSQWSGWTFVNQNTLD